MGTLSELNVRIGQMKNDALQFGPGDVEILKSYGFGNKGGNAFFAQGMLEIGSARNCDACMAVKTADKNFSLVFTLGSDGVESIVHSGEQTLENLLDNNMPFIF